MYDSKKRAAVVLMYVAQKMGIEEDDRRFCEGTFISLSLYDPGGFRREGRPRGWVEKDDRSRIKK